MTRTLPFPPRPAAPDVPLVHVVVIRGVWEAPNAEQAASDYLSCHDDAGVA